MGRFFNQYRLVTEADLTRGSAPAVASAGVGLAAPPVAAAKLRARAVDALRGLGILVMVLGQTKPYGVLPAWMYHAQEPPPTHEVNLHLAGLTFSDLVFPFFLFTIGVAIPLSLSGPLQRGGARALLRIVGTRGLLLGFLALFRQHFAVVPPAIQPERAGWLMALAGLPVLFAIFIRLPEGWPLRRRLPIRLAGWAGAAALFAVAAFPDGSGFDPDRVDVILMAAAACVVFGGLIWMTTRNTPLVRLLVVGAVAVLQPPYLQYLCIALPGTIVGDVILKWSRADAREWRYATAVPWGPYRAAALAAVLMLLAPAVLTGVQTRYVDETIVIVAVLSGAALALSWRHALAVESAVAVMIRWGAAWLLLGLLLDPIEGGTQKTPATLAWMFQSLGVGVMLVAAFTIVIDILAKRWLQLLVDNGQNPMMAYVGYAMLVLPILGLSGVKGYVESLEPPPWIAFGWGVLSMLLVAWVVRWCTRRRLYWRT